MTLQSGGVPAVLGGRGCTYRAAAGPQTARCLNTGMAGNTPTGLTERERRGGSLREKVSCVISAKCQQVVLFSHFTVLHVYLMLLSKATYNRGKNYNLCALAEN